MPAKLPKYVVATPSDDGTIEVHYSGHDKPAALEAFNANPKSQCCHLVQAGGFKHPKPKPPKTT